MSLDEFDPRDDENQELAFVLEFAERQRSRNLPNQSVHTPPAVFNYDFVFELPDIPDPALLLDRTQPTDDSQAMRADSTYDTITQGRRPPTGNVPRGSGAQPRTNRQNAQEPRPGTPARPTLTDRQLVELRQARALAGLDNSELDEEIARRVIQDPQAWGWVGREMVTRGFANNRERST